MPPPTEFDRRKYASPGEVARAWGVSAEAVRRLCRLGRIPGAIQVAERPGPGATIRWHIPREAMDSYPAADDQEDQRVPALAGVA